MATRCLPGGTMLVAHLTAGHTRGATTYTAKVKDGAKIYDVVFFSSLRPGSTVTPAIAAEFDRTFSLVRRLPCDVPLGDHPGDTTCTPVREARFRRIESFHRQGPLSRRGERSGSDVPRGRRGTEAGRTTRQPLVGARSAALIAVALEAVAVVGLALARSSSADWRSDG